MLEASSRRIRELYSAPCPHAIDAAERANAKLVERPPQPHAVVISWSGNNVVTDNPAALAGWATHTEAKRQASMDIIERNARTVMTARDRLRHLFHRGGVLRVVATRCLWPDGVVQNSDGRSCPCLQLWRAGDAEVNRRHYIQYIQYFVAAAKLGHSIGQKTKALEREYLDLDFYPDLWCSAPGDWWSGFSQEGQGKGACAIIKVAALVPKREILLKEEKEASPLYPLKNRRCCK